MLGPLRGEDDRPIEVGGARLLLIRLALDSGRVVTADRPAPACGVTG
jgi:hypothetical protein